MADVTIYTRDWCGFCAAALKLLKKKEANVTELNATGQSDIRKEMIARAEGANTFPQIFIGEEHIGGCNELYALEEAGKLDEKLSR